MTYIKMLVFNIHDASANGWLNAAFVQSNSGHSHNGVVNLICWDHDCCTRDFLGMCMQKWLFFCSQKTWLLNNLANVCLLAVQYVPSRSDEQFHGRMVSCPGNQWKLYYLLTHYCSVQIDIGFLCLEIKERPFLYAMAISFVVCQGRDVKSICDKGRRNLL
jgi:hypothetical protein